MYIGVIGSALSDPDLDKTAYDVGVKVAEAGHILVCGGRGGVMQAACRGARDAGCITVGILPGNDRSEANPYLTVSIPTGLGETRNALVVRASDGLIAVGGGFGTLSEIAFALKLGKPIVGIKTWDLRGNPFPKVSDAASALDLLMNQFE